MNAEAAAMLHLLLDQAIALASLGESEVCLTFQGVDIAIRPDSLVSEHEAELERKQKLLPFVHQLADLLRGLFISSSRIHNVILRLPDGYELLQDIPSDKCTFREQFNGIALVLCLREIVLTSEFWELLREQASTRIDMIEPVQKKFEREFDLT